MTKTIKQAKYGDKIVRIDGAEKKTDYIFLGINPISNNEILYLCNNRYVHSKTISVNSGIFFVTFALKPQERWVLVKDERHVISRTFSSMESAIDHAEITIKNPSDWEAVQLKS